jgi:NitT/TauT family transport system substrate-binding protein
MKEFLNRNCYSAAAMIYNEWASVLETVDPNTGQLYQDSQFTELSFEAYGVASLEDGVFVNNDWLAQPGNYDLAVKFLRASFKGWQYAYELHPVFLLACCTLLL